MLTIGLVSGGDRFEDFFDKIGVSLETFRDEFTGGWLFNYVRALRLSEVRTVLVFTSARVEAPVHFTHADSEVPVWVLPSPRFHRRIRNAQHRYRPTSRPADGHGVLLRHTPEGHGARCSARSGVDAIVCQEYEQPRFDACVLLGRLLGLPVFATYQGANETKAWIERPIRQKSIRLGGGADHSFQPRRCPGAERVPLGIAQDRTRFQTRWRGETTGSAREARDAVRPRHRPRTPVLSPGMAVCRIHTKGLDLLLDAWDRIARSGRSADILLLLVGNGRDADMLRRRIASSQKVRWIDRYVFDRRTLWCYLSAADLYAMTSRREGFAVAVLEAMACGLPAVGSDVAGVADALPRGEADGGIIVPRDNPAALAGALLRLLDDSELAERLGRVARQRMETEFSLQAIGPKLRDFIFGPTG